MCFSYVCHHLSTEMRIKKIQHRRGFGGGRVGVRYSTLLSLFDDYGIGGNHQICRCSIMASTSVFQTDDTGSIPVTGLKGGNLLMEIRPIMIAIKNCTVRQLLRKVKSCIFGALAQSGEHYPCKVGVMGSNPIRSTKPSVILRIVR